MGVTDKVLEFLWSVAIKKGVKRGIQALISFIVAKGVVVQAAKFGITIDTTQLEVAGVPAVYGVLEVARNFIKQKTGLSWL